MYPLWTASMAEPSAISCPRCAPRRRYSRLSGRRGCGPLTSGFLSDEPVPDEVLAAFPPLLGGDGIPHMVLPRAVDLQIAERDAFLSNPELLDDTAARTVARNDGDLQPMQRQLLEGEAEHDHDRLGHKTVAGLGLIDPVAHVCVLEGPSLDGREIDLAREATLDEDPKSVATPQLTFPVACTATGCEYTAVIGRVRLTGDGLGLPFDQPVVGTLPDLPPLVEVVRRQGA